MGAAIAARGLIARALPKGDSRLRAPEATRSTKSFSEAAAPFAL
eukprot:CAMPEP_0171786134 /NCGR_PEP_ID=MMETSP0991-20121206/63102_1 /TAXON_ID=483369 /ORGANISM="non described non described, Strain CCMP2098" /LENGTH=43 /DNA_ID= /DNA_START= /DNA_END= /DNA_ORIENTATION=